MPGEISRFMNELVEGRLAQDAIVRTLTELRERGESASDILEAVRVMRSKCVPVSTPYADLLDTCGTGGDALGTVNASTVAALAAAAAGARVAKHGNRSVSGLFGSADLLESFGIRIELTPAEVAQSIEKTGFGFMYAPLFHPAMKHAAAARKQIQGKTLFNCLGPLTNPAGATRHLLGVYDARLLRPVAETLKTLGSLHAIVVHGEDGIDEVALSGPTRVAELLNGTIRLYTVTPAECRVREAGLETLRCASSAEAAAAARSIIDGAEGPRTDFVVLNTAFALKAAGIAETPAEGVERSRELIRSGAVRRKIDEIRKLFPK